jgi:hypothetical protein
MVLRLMQKGDVHQQRVMLAVAHVAAGWSVSGPSMAGAPLFRPRYHPPGPSFFP